MDQLGEYSLGSLIPTLLIEFRICIIVAFTIYTMAGRQIYLNHRQLRLVCQSYGNLKDMENPFDSFKTTEVNITSELAHPPHENLPVMMVNTNATSNITPDRGYDRYTVTIASAPMDPRIEIPPTPSGELFSYRKNRAAMEANTAAWGYTKCALLFFVSLLITWVSGFQFRPKSVSLLRKQS